MNYGISIGTYAIGPVQGDIESFSKSEANEMEIRIPTGRTIQSVRNSYANAIRSTNRPYTMTQKRGRLYIKKPF